MSNTLLQIEEARAKRREAVERMQQVQVALQDAPEDTNEEAKQALRDDFDAAKRTADEMKESVSRLEEIHKQTQDAYAAETPSEEERSQVGDETPAPRSAIRVNQPLTYSERSQHSFVLDMREAATNTAAAERIRRHSVEMAVEKRDLTSGAGLGGDIIAPVFLSNYFIDVARASRVTSNLGQNAGAPPRAQAFTIPRLATDPGVVIQGSDNAAIGESDATTGLLTVNRTTIAGIQDISQQALDDTTPGLDQIIFYALAQQYALQLNAQVISGSGAAGNIRGILNTASTIAVTAATATGAGVYSSVLQAVSQIETLRFVPPTAVIMHPRRFWWLAAQVDGNGRPLVVPIGAYPGAVGGSVEAQNPMGVVSQSTQAYGLKGYFAGLPVYTDPGLPTNLGAGTNQDPILVLRAEDLIRWEDPTPRAETFREVLSQNLTVRLRVYGYAAFTAGAYPKGVAVVNGVGLVAPSGF